MLAALHISRAVVQRIITDLCVLDVTDEDETNVQDNCLVGIAPLPVQGSELVAGAVQQHRGEA